MLEFAIIIFCLSFLALIFYRRYKLLGEGVVVPKDSYPEDFSDGYKNPETLCKIGLSYLRDNLPHKAEEIFAKLSVDYPDNACYLSNFGLALYSQQKLQEAKEAYSRAVVLDDSRAPRFCSLARVLHELGCLEEAIFHLKRAIEIESLNIEYLLFLIQLLKSSGQHGEAKEVIRLVLQIDPANADVKEFC